VIQPIRLEATGLIHPGLDAWGKLFFSVYLVGLVLVLLHLENLYRNAGRVTRPKVKYLIVGVFLAFAYQIVAVSYALLYGIFHPLHPFFGALAFLPGLGMIAFSLVRHRLLDVDIFVSRYVIYRSLTLALVGGYLLSLGLVAEIFRWLDFPLDLLSGTFLALLGGVALSLLLLSEDLRRRAKSYIHAHFYKHKYDYREEWMEYTQRLSRAIAIPDIAAQTLNRILEVMWVRQAAMYTVGESPGQMTLAHQVQYDSLPTKLELDTAAVKALQEHAKFIPSAAENGNRPDVIGELSRQMFEGVPVGLLVPVAALDNLVGLLVVGPELSGKAFGVDDGDLLAAMAAQAGALILNARLAQEAFEGREIQAVAVLSTFITHDLKNAVSMLSMLAENAKIHIGKPEFQADAIRTLSEVTTKMRTLLAALSSSRERAVDQVQLVNLGSAVEVWIQEIGPQLPPRIQVETRLRSTPDVRVEPEQLRTVLHNLLLNSVEAMPDDGKIQVETSQEDGQAVLAVTDSGRGMTPEFIRQRLFRPFQSTKARGLGIGLYQCRQIVQAIGGTLTAESQEGKGTRMVVRLPTEAGSAQSA
jgi:putative PEP-CTERM system histidine kinase